MQVLIRPTLGFEMVFWKICMLQWRSSFWAYGTPTTINASVKINYYSFTLIIMFFQIANTNTFIQMKSVRQAKVLDIQGTNQKCLKLDLGNQLDMIWA